MKELGGLRHAKRDSINTGWKNASFRGLRGLHADAGICRRESTTLIKSPARKTTAIMCAEAVPWRCHRSLVADALGRARNRASSTSSAPRALSRTTSLRSRASAARKSPTPAKEIWHWFSSAGVSPALSNYKVGSATMCRINSSCWFGFFRFHGCLLLPDCSPIPPRTPAPLAETT